MFFVYVLKSEKDGKLYYGHTEDLERRIIEHNNGNVVSTKNRRPFHLVYFEQVESKESAVRKEKYFKSGFGRKYFKNKIKALSSNG